MENENNSKGQDSDTEQTSNFKLINPVQLKIRVIDPTRDFIRYWDYMLKSYLHTTTIQLNYKNKLSPIKILDTLNIKLIDANLEEKVDPSNTDNSKYDFEDILFTINVLKLRKNEDLTPLKIDSFRASNNPEYFCVFLHELKEPNEAEIRSGQKITDDLKRGNLLNQISYLPLNKEGNEYMENAISQFFKEFSFMMSSKINSRIKYINELYEGLLKDKQTYELVDKYYLFIESEFYLINYLMLGNYYLQIIYILQNQLMKSSKLLIQECNILPYPILNFDMKDIIEAITNKNLNIIQIQLFIIYQMIYGYYKISSYNKINFYIKMILNEFSMFSNSFKSMYHYIFFMYTLSKEFINLYKNVFLANEKNNDILLQGLIFLHSYNLKLLKNYASFSKIIVIPNSSFIFKTCQTSQKNKQSLDKEINKIIINDNIEIDITKNGNLKDSISFLGNRFNDEIKSLFLNKKNFYVEIINILNKIIYLSNLCDQSYMSIKAKIDMLPYLFSLLDFNKMKEILVEILNKEIDNHNIISRWDYAYEYLIYMLISLVCCLDKSFDNLLLILNTIKVKKNKFEKLMKIFQCSGETNKSNIFDEYASKYINEYPEIKDNEKIDKTIFSMDSIIQIEFNENKKINFNLSNKESLNTKIKYTIINPTSFSFENIKETILIFRNKYDNELVEYKLSKPIDKINKLTNDKIDYLSLNDLSKFKCNNSYIFEKIKFILKNNIIGIYNINEQQKIELIIKVIDCSVKYSIYPSYETNELKSTVSNAHPENTFYFNCLNSMKVKLEDIPENMDNKILSIEIKDEDINKNNKIRMPKLIVLSELQKENKNLMLEDIEISDSKILINKTANLNIKNKNLLELNIPFVVESTDYENDKNSEKAFKIITSIIDKNKKDSLYFNYIELMSINLIHLFSMKNKFRYIEKTKSLLMQTSFSLNKQITGILIYNRENKSNITLANNSHINYVLSFPANIDDISNILWNDNNFLYFYIGVDCLNKYRLCYTELDILEKIKKILNLNYYVEFNIDSIEHNIFEEMIINIYVKKYFQEESILMLKIKENNNWSIIGKAKIIEYISEGEIEMNKRFSLFPLQDGYLQIPEIEIMEFPINKNDDISKNSKFNNFNILNFKKIREGTVIVGNTRIVKINSIKSCTLRPNLI